MGQEATVKTEHGTADCFQIEIGALQGCILSPWEMLGYDAQAGIKIAGRNISILRYADDNTLIAESE